MANEIKSSVNEDKNLGTTVEDRETAQGPPFEGKTLFTVAIEQEIVVLAEDEAEAEEIAKEVACGHDIEWLDAMYSAYEGGKALPFGWDKTQPFGYDGRETCEQIIKALEEYERSRPPTKAELEAMGQQPLIADA